MLLLALTHRVVRIRSGILAAALTGTLSLPLSAQEFANKDSLAAVVQQSKDDSNKVMALIYLGQYYESSVPDSAAYYYKKAGTLSTQLNYPEGRLKYIANYTYLLNMKGDYAGSITLNTEAVAIARKLDNGVLTGKALTNLANAYLFNQQLELALEQYQLALPYLEKSGNAGYLSVLYSNLATVYFNLEQYEPALLYCRKGVGLAKQVNDSAGLGAALLNAGNAHLRLRKYDSARSCYQESYNIASKLKDAYLMNSILLGRIELNDRTGITKENRALLETVRQLSQQLDDQRSLALCYEGWVAYYFNQKAYTLAARYNDSLILLAATKNQEDLLIQAYQNKAALSITSGDPEAYQQWIRKADSINQALKGAQVTRKIKELEVKYGLLQKQQELDLERAENRNKRIQNTILWISLAAVLLISLLLYRTFSLRRRLQIQKIQELEKEKQLLAATAILQGQEEERSRLARDLHDSMGGMLSGIKNSFTDMKDSILLSPEDLQRFEKGINLLDTSINEFRRVAHNMMPEALQKFGLNAALRDFCAGMNSSNQLRVIYQSYDLDGIVLPTAVNTTIYRVVQELLTNILKHAAASEAVVEVSKVDQKLLITVEDNGKGFDPALLESAAGIGWNNIRNRIDFLKGKLDIQSAPGEGTAVNIEINV